MATKGFKKAIKNLRRKADRHYQNIAGYTVDSTLEKTPIRSGKAAANWRAAVNGTDKSVDGRATFRDIHKTHRKNRRIARSVKLGDSFTVTNNLAYAQEIEYGSDNHSPKAPVRLTAQEIRRAQSQ